MPHSPAIQPAFFSPPVTDTAETPASRVRLGDLWQLGSHRLLCGDCTDAADVARLMQAEESETSGGTEAAAMLFLDPPYGVGYGMNRNPRRFGPAIRGDNLGEQGTYDLLRQALKLAPLKPGGVFYVCSAGGSNETLFRLALRDAGLPLRQSLVWVKNHFALSRQDYQWRNEIVLYGWKVGAPHCWNGGRTQTTVWELSRPTPPYLHPAMKPTALIERAIENSSRPGESVYDGFGGSGSTLLACETLGRRCRMMEIEPCYCDIILQRWEEATGNRAVRLENNTRP